MADIALYVDPVCPFAWVTARWLLTSAGDRHTITLEQLSLAVLDQERSPDDAGHRAMLTRSRRIGRVFAAAVRSTGHGSFTPLYLSVGARLHPRDPGLEDESAVADALTEAGLDRALVLALDDPAYDADVAEAHRASQTALGGPGGSPIITVDGHGFSGPVLTAPPDGHRATELLDALVTVATAPEFAALQRPYAGPPALG
ncbi:DSBA oxidoreductase [Nocardia rhamnosiphila]|uniref:mycothiol-dependent nitroreductase Rv2466c family protein n=1 Tax=Nocardia rhamnosiphila TaxID=426716 RepID=UPI0004C2DFB2|nr:DSBA oxidoreductase [Nocardia rhamnosiphila]